MGSEVVGLQAPADDDVGRMPKPSNPSVGKSHNESHVKTVIAGIHNFGAIGSNTPSKTATARVDFDDASTARTELSTEIDEMSTLLREKLSYGSSFISPDNSFDNAGVTRVRSKQGDLLRIDESSASTKEHKNGDYEKASLLDMDDEDDDHSEGVTKTSLGNNVASNNRADSQPAGNFAVDILKSDSRAEFYDTPSFALTPCSINGSILRDSESRDKFYGGYSRSNLASPMTVHGKGLTLSERRRMQFYGSNGDVSAALSSGSLFANGTLDTDPKIEFYRVSCSEAAEPLSCREKLVQPALSCDEELWQRDDAKQKANKSSYKETGSSSIFSAVTCCFMPTQP